MSTNRVESKIVLPTPDSCRWRIVRDDGAIACGVVVALLNQPSDLPKVSYQQCVACCESFPPNPGTLNPVVASLLQTHLDTLPSTHQDTLRRMALAGLQSEPTLIGSLNDSRSSPIHDLKLTEIVPIERAFGCVSNWSVGVTTAPRKQSVLGRCLEGIVQAGWSDIHLFLDGTVRIPSEFSHLSTTWREHSVGASAAWYLALTELVARQPDADAYLMLQDDALPHFGDSLREYLELALWPAAKPSLVSLYTPGLISQRGWHRIPSSWDWGTLAVIFPNALARGFLSDSDVVRLSLPSRPGAHRPIPEIVRKWIHRARVDVWCPSPSLTQHVGATSTIWPLVGLSRNRTAPWFSAEDAQTIYPHQSLADFREQAFPCQPGDSDRYNERVQRGLARMRQIKVALCAICRDVGAYLPRTAARMERLGSMFSDYRIIVVENDSIDSTVRFLRDWESRNTHVEAHCERLDHPKFLGGRDVRRSTALAQYRNKYLTRIGELQSVECFSHVLVIDADLAGGWSYDGIASSFAHDEWDVIGSYGLEHYSLPPQVEPRRWHYDRWAFRAPHDSAAAVLLGDHQDPLRRGMPLLEVDSCFGGLALYDVECLLACEYGGEDCEHVVLHRRLRDMGYGRQFLNPSQIVLRSHLVA